MQSEYKETKVRQSVQMVRVLMIKIIRMVNQPISHSPL